MTGNTERQVHFGVAPAFDSEDKTGVNNHWIYNRAPDGYLFELVEVEYSANREANFRGIISVFDGHEYTHWNLWPGVESRELLHRTELGYYTIEGSKALHGWECKEYTIGMRSTYATEPFKACYIMWYRLKKASRLELLEYAIKHPKNQDMFKRVLRGTTVEPTEAET